MNEVLKCIFIGVSSIFICVFSASLILRDVKDNIRINYYSSKSQAKNKQKGES